MLMSESASFALPSWLSSQLSGHADSVSVMAIDLDLNIGVPVLGEVTRAHNGIPPMLFHQASVSGGSKTVNF